MVNCCLVPLFWLHDRADGAPAHGFAAVFAAAPFVRDLFAPVPAVRDETHLLSGSPDSHVVVARWRGEGWFVAGLNGLPEPISIDILAGGDRKPVARDASDPLWRTRRSRRGSRQSAEATGGHAARRRRLRGAILASSMGAEKRVIGRRPTLARRGCAAASPLRREPRVFADREDGC